MIFNQLYTKKKYIFWIILLISLCLVLFHYISIYRSRELSYTSEEIAKTLNMYQKISYDKKSNNYGITLTYQELNSYLQHSSFQAITSNKDIQVNSLCINLETTHLTGKLKTNNGHSFIDFSATYSLTFIHDQLIFNINNICLGQSPKYMSQYVFEQKYAFDYIAIPTKSNSPSLFDDYFKEILVDTPINLVANKSEFTGQIGDLKTTYAHELYPIDFLVSTDDLSTDYPVRQNNGQKYIELSQLQLMATALNMSHIFDVLNQANYHGEFLTNTSDDVILRLSTFNKEYVIDLNLVFSIEVMTDQSLKIKLDHILTPYGQKIELSNKTFLSTIEELIDNIDTKPLDQYHLIRSSLNLTHLHLFFEQTSWTIMVYMIGSDLESSYNFYNNSLFGHASTDLEEMMQGHNSDNIHLVIETGGTKNWKLDAIDSSVNQRWKISNTTMELLDTLDKKNMSDPKTLYDFTSWAIDSYPSDNYALILWNHGGGSLYGFGLDEYFPDDSLTLDELDYVLESVTHEQSMNFEVIGFDACLMATLETAATLEPYANYLIASEETEPDSGWDYERILSQLGDGEAYNGNSFGELVVSGFFDASIEENQDGLLTLSVIDLKYVPTLIQRMNRLFESVIETNQFNLLSKTIPQVKAFGGNTELTGYTDHYDIENFAKRTLEFLPSESNRLLAALDDAVIYKANGYLTTDAGGLSFYLPFYDLEKNKNLTDLYSRVSFSESYFLFVDQFVNFRLSNSVSSSMIPYTLYKDSRPYKLQIAEGFEHLVSDIYLGISVFENRTNQELRLDLGYDAWIYENFETGLYEESFGFWPAIEDTYLPISVVYNGNDYIEYETPILLNNEPVMLITAWLYDEERYVIFGCRPIITDEGLTDRNTIEFKDGDQIDILYTYYNKNTDQWFEEIATSITFDRASDLNVSNKSLKENSEYGLSFIIKDLNATLSFTEMIRFIYE